MEGVKRVLAVVIGIALLVGCGTAGRVDQVVDEMEDNGSLARYCSAVQGADKLGFTEEESFAAFRQGYTLDDPPARDVFEEIRARC